MKSLALATVFIAATWISVVSLYAIYESYRLIEGLEALAFVRHEQGLLNSMNSVFPSAVACLIFLFYIRKATPVKREVLGLATISLCLAAALALKAGHKLFPDADNRALSNQVWWLPDHDSPED